MATENMHLKQAEYLEAFRTKLEELAELSDEYEKRNTRFPDYETLQNCLFLLEKTKQELAPWEY